MKKMFGFGHAGMLLCVTLSSAETDGRFMIFNESFERPTETQYFFPPGEGATFQRFSPGLTAWSNKGGQLSIKYGHGYGYERSGGLHCVVAKPAETGGYLKIACESFKLPVVSPDLIGSYLRSLTVDFAINMPVGREMDLIMVPLDVPADYKSLAFPSKLMLGRIKGTGEYQKISLNAGQAMRPNAEPLIIFLQDCLANGMESVTLTLDWHMHGGSWFEGDEFLMDNILITMARRP